MREAKSVLAVLGETGLYGAVRTQIYMWESLSAFYEEMDTSWERHAGDDLAAQGCWHLSEVREHGPLWSDMQS